ncbi:MAG TPA: PH domain-containing protein [Actinotalea caeni]|uniref:PH domain-containing protein n=1 Tax=Actinotalea caeni TaxID=1348467 RepID=UPI002B4B3B03|nr:PH domain-containing protein [Actinotalea caeni]HLV54475.1 PH domain-containing protein [Actinotalea caeni]
MESAAFDVPGVTWNRVSDRLIGVRRLTVAVFLGIPALATVVPAVIVGSAMWLLPAVLVLLVAWAWWLIPRQVRAIGYAELEDDLLIRKGVLFRSLTVVPYGRMQYVDVQAGPLMRRAGMAQVQLHTASASTDASIPGLLEAEASRLRDRLTEAGEARLAGL